MTTSADSPDETQIKNPPSEESIESPENGGLELVKDIEERLKGKLPEKVSRVVREVIQERHFFSGPMPPPNLLAGYERVCPGWGERLLQMGLDEQKHRHECERRLLGHADRSLDLDDKEASYSKTALIFGFIAFLVIALLGMYSLRLGYPKVAIGLFGTFTVGVIGNFIRGRAWGKNTNDQKPSPTARSQSKQNSRRKKK